MPLHQWVSARMSWIGSVFLYIYHAQWWQSVSCKFWNLIKLNWWSLGWWQLWVCRREGPTIHGSTIMSWCRPSVGVVWKCWAGKVKVSPTGLIWEERGAESSSKATQKKITITHNYSLKTVGKGALYLPVLAQHSTVALIATLLLVHITFCASCHTLFRHAQGISSVHSTALKIEWLRNWKALKIVLFGHNVCV